MEEPLELDDISTEYLKQLKSIAAEQVNEQLVDFVSTQPDDVPIGGEIEIIEQEEIDEDLKALHPFERKIRSVCSQFLRILDLEDPKKVTPYCTALLLQLRLTIFDWVSTRKSVLASPKPKLRLELFLDDSNNSFVGKLLELHLKDPGYDVLIKDMLDTLFERFEFQEVRSIGRDLFLHPNRNKETPLQTLVLIGNTRHLHKVHQYLSNLLNFDDWDTIIDGANGNNLLLTAIEQVLLLYQNNVPYNDIADAIEVAEYILKNSLCSPIAPNYMGQNAFLIVAREAYRAVQTFEKSTHEFSVNYRDSYSESEYGTALTSEQKENFASQQVLKTKMKLKWKEDLDKMKGRRLLDSQKAQQQFKNFFEVMLEQVHPFVQVSATTEDIHGDSAPTGKKEPLVSALYRVSPKAADLLLDKFKGERNFNPREDKFEISYDYSLKNPKYAEFMESTEARDSVLHLLEQQNGNILRHKAISALMEAIWNVAIRKIVLFEMSLFVALLITSCLLINLGVEPRTDLAWKIITVILCGSVFVSALLVLIVETAHWVNQGISYFKDPWNTPDWLCTLYAIYAAARVVDPDYSWNFAERQVLAVAILYFWMKALEYGGCFGTSGEVSRLFLAMASFLVKFLLVMLLFILAFGHSLYLSVYNDSPQQVSGFENVGVSILRVYRGLMGDTLPYDEMIEGRSSGESVLTVLLYCSFTILGVILLLNLLIALMTKVFDAVKENIAIDFLKTRADFIRKKLQVYVLSNRISKKRNFATLEADRWRALYRSVAEKAIGTEDLHLQNSADGERWDVLDERISTLELKMSESMDGSEKLLTSLERDSILEFASAHYKHANAHLRLKAVQTLGKLNFESAEHQNDVAENSADIKIFTEIACSAACDSENLVSEGALELLLKRKSHLDRGVVAATTLPFLQSDKPDVQIAACAVISLVRLGDKEAHTGITEVLLKLLVSPDWGVSRAACLALVRQKIQRGAVYSVILQVLELWKIDANYDLDDVKAVAEYIGLGGKFSFQMENLVQALCKILVDASYEHVELKQYAVKSLQQMMPFVNVAKPIREKFSEKGTEGLSVQQFIQGGHCTYLLTGPDYERYYQNVHRCEPCGFMIGYGLCSFCVTFCHAERSADNKEGLPAHPKNNDKESQFVPGFCDCPDTGKCLALPPQDHLLQMTSRSLSAVIEQYSQEIGALFLLGTAFQALAGNRKPTAEVISLLLRSLANKNLHGDAREAIVDIGRQNPNFVRMLLENETAQRDSVEPFVIDVLGDLEIKENFVVEYLRRQFHRPSEPQFCAHVA
eukprot:TRINITY_DN3208_c0_g1_i1.p1 TRINITY_DN3208_c0_g1~~TRINITY_DN3208_c0_g1_i1.p1  ORF type:complete len:1295 (-),score=371.93 TRINITY_DN3208_c0_g1_i1:65-3949(-)